MNYRYDTELLKNIILEVFFILLLITNQSLILQIRLINLDPYIVIKHTKLFIKTFIINQQICCCKRYQQQKRISAQHL